MSLYKRAGVWWYDFTVNGRRYRNTTFQTSKEHARTAEGIARAEACALVDLSKPPLTVRQAAVKWFAARADGHKSVVTISQRLEIMLRHIDGEALITAIGAAEIETAVQARRLDRTRQGRAPAPATVNRDIIDTTLRPIMRYAKSPLGYPVQDIIWKDVRLKEPKGRDRTFTGAEIHAWRAALPAHHRVVFDFAARYGVRLREAFFTLDCVDAEAGRILLRDRKNGRGHNLRLLPPDHALIAATYGRAKAAGLETLWFREMKNGSLRPIHWRGFQSASRTALDRVGIADARPAHDLRHHAGNTLNRRTGNLAAVKALLGHDNIQSTMRYVHADDEDVFDAMRHAYGTETVSGETEIKENNDLDAIVSGT